MASSVRHVGKSLVFNEVEKVLHTGVFNVGFRHIVNIGNEFSPSDCHRLVKDSVMLLGRREKSLLLGSQELCKYNMVSTWSKGLSVNCLR